MSIKSFFKKYGKQTTTNFDLVKIAEKEGISPFYVAMRDELNDLPSDNPIFVITNIHTSKERGVHWSCLATMEKGNFFFDSYGLPPTIEVKDFLKHATYNTFCIPKPGTSECGQLCLFVLKELKEGRDFVDIILSLKIMFHNPHAVNIAGSSAQREVCNETTTTVDYTRLDDYLQKNRCHVWFFKHGFK